MSYPEQISTYQTIVFVTMESALSVYGTFAGSMLRVLTILGPIDVMVMNPFVNVCRAGDKNRRLNA